MATLQQYFETDFNYAVRVHVTFPHEGEEIKGTVLYDVSAHSAFVSCYLAGSNRSFEFIVGFLQMLQYGRTKLKFTNQISLPVLVLRFLVFDNRTMRYVL